MGFESVFGTIGMTFGGSALAGGVTGFAAKKILKLAVAVVGIQLAVFAYLDHQGFLNIHWQAFDNALAGVQHSLETLPSWLTTLGATMPVGAGFVAGFLLTFKKA